MGTTVNFENILSLMLDFGETMISSGAEVDRVEDSLTRLGISYDALKMNVYATPSNLTVTLVDKNSNTYTQSRRMISNSSTDFSKLEKLNSICRLKCEHKIQDNEFVKAFEAIKYDKSRKLKLYIGSMFAAGAFSIFFGGSLFDALAAVVFSLLICYMQIKFQRFCPNTFMFNLITSFIVGVCICTTSKLFNLNAEMVIVGDIMLLIPGIAFTNSIRNLLSGDTNTGVMRLVETILWSGSLATGFVFSILLFGV